MNIAITGAPGSGKGDLAEGIRAELGLSQDAVVFDYVNVFSSITDIAVGHFAGYITNLQIALDRLAWEQSARRNNDTVITVGTLAETLIYAALHGKVASESPNNPDRQAEVARSVTTQNTLGMLMHDTWKYDHVLYLPYPEEKRDGSWDAILDKDLPAVFDTFFIPFTVIVGTPEERLEQALTQIRIDDTPAPD